MTKEKNKYSTMGLVRVRLWEELQKYTEPRYDAKHKSDGTPVKGYDLGRRDLARELWTLIKENMSE